MEWLVPALFAILAVTRLAAEARALRGRGACNEAFYRHLPASPRRHSIAASPRLRDHRDPVRRLDEVLNERRERLHCELQRANLPAGRKSEIFDRLATVRYLEASRKRGRGSTSGGDRNGLEPPHARRHVSPARNAAVGPVAG